MMDMDEKCPLDDGRKWNIIESIHRKGMLCFYRHVFCAQWH